MFDHNNRVTQLYQVVQHTCKSVNIGKVKSGDWDYVAADIKAVNDVTVARGQIVKVIFENCFLTDDEKIKLCEICGEIGVAFVKTSTGSGCSAAFPASEQARQSTPAKTDVDSFETSILIEIS